MARFAVTGEDTNTALTTILYFVNGATDLKRLKLYDVLIGSDHVPADNAFQYNIFRLTDENATPGGTALTPVKIDESDAAAASNGVEAPTGEPTLESAQPVEIAGNQRSLLRWVCAPGGELVCAALEDHGFALYVAQAANAVVANATMHYIE